MAPATLEERLAHLAEAKRKLGTRIPWLADSMDNAVKHAFGDRPNSEFVVDPTGKIVVARSWSDPVELRRDLEKLVGKAETFTEPVSARYPAGEETGSEEKVAKDVVARISRPTGASPLVVKAAPGDPSVPLYLKLRVEAPLPQIQRDGEGELHLSFWLDPIHRVHWNNLAPPLQFEFTVPESAGFRPQKGEAPKVAEESDRDPREFLISVAAGADGLAKPFTIRADYYACDDEGRWCKAVSQEFTVFWETDRDGGRVMERAGRTRGGPEMRAGGSRGPDPAAILSRFDNDGDGVISRDEAIGPMALRFEQLDTDGDGQVTLDELARGLRGGR